MENASKALTMAAGVLIAVMTLTLLVYGYMNMNNMQATVQKNEEIEQLVAFNKSYESYNKKLLRGTEVISVMNKAIDNNIKYENEWYYKITVEFKLKTNINNIVANTTYDMDYYNSNIKKVTSVFDELKTRVFDCTEIRYHSESGRINYMKFVERKIT